MPALIMFVVSVSPAPGFSRKRSMRPPARVSTTP
jgi:hypothetical protein